MFDPCRRTSACCLVVQQISLVATNREPADQVKSMSTWSFSCVKCWSATELVHGPKNTACHGDHVDLEC